MSGSVLRALVSGEAGGQWSPAILIPGTPLSDDGEWCFLSPRTQ